MTMQAKTAWKRCVEFINANYQEAEIYELLKERFGISERELEEQFGETYGISVWDYILNRRFNAAKELLRFTIQPMDEVIEKSGIGRTGNCFISCLKKMKL